MIIKAEWDSEFFKYPIGILNVTEINISRIKNLLDESKAYRLIYIFSERELENIEGLELVDKKVVFSKTVSEISPCSKEIIEFNPMIHSYDELLSLVYLSGTYSRFKRDEKFKQNEYSRLYKEWLDKSLNKKLAFKILIKQVNKEIAGFVTLRRKDKNVSEIGLIAVNTKFQGRNIASQLIQECEFVSLQENFSVIEVATQNDNQPAKMLYEKNNFKIKKTTNIYHFWN